VAVAEFVESMVRLLLADDHDIVREGLRDILQVRSDWEVVAEAADGEEAVRKAIETNPDVAIVDYSLPLMNGIEVTHQIRSRMGTEVLIFTMHDRDIVIEQLLNAGACGYLLKSDANKSLIEAVESLANHEPFFTRRVSATLLNSFLALPKRSGMPLSGRECSVVQLIAEGHTNKEVGDLLHISLKTVESHRAAAMRKLKISSAAGLVRYAIRNKIIEP
jgi:DNA-binding NarL/FixJ family response regulator